MRWFYLYLFQILYISIKRYFSLIIHLRFKTKNVKKEKVLPVDFRSPMVHVVSEQKYFNMITGKTVVLKIEQYISSEFKQLL